MASFWFESYGLLLALSSMLASKCDGLLSYVKLQACDGLYWSLLQKECRQQLGATIQEQLTQQQRMIGRCIWQV